jgi:hypothetical protein
MLVLFETPAGYAIFKISDENKIKKPEDVASIFQSTEKAQKLYFYNKLGSNFMHLKNLKIMLKQ